MRAVIGADLACPDKSAISPLRGFRLAFTFRRMSDSISFEMISLILVLFEAHGERDRERIGITIRFKDDVSERNGFESVGNTKVTSETQPTYGTQHTTEREQHQNRDATQSGTETMHRKGDLKMQILNQKAS